MKPNITFLTKKRTRILHVLTFLTKSYIESLLSIHRH